MTSGGKGMGAGAALFANGIVFALLGLFLVMFHHFPEPYYHMVQEDGVLEWATFWGFIAACVAYAMAVRGQHRRGTKVPWFLAGISLFCFLVGMEEISWGQRVFGYTSPQYFLEENVQQELNFHNVIDTELRKATFRVLVAGYGVVLPVVTLVPVLRRLLGRIAIIAPPFALVPSFLGIVSMHITYGFNYTGEFTEAALAFAFLCAGLAHVTIFERALVPLAEQADNPLLWRCAMASLAAGALSFAMATWHVHYRSSDPANVSLAQDEVSALKADLLALAKRWKRRSPVKCGVHKRVYTFVQDYKGAEALWHGDFSKLAERGLPEFRADYFIDPWNSSYWIRRYCDKSKNLDLIVLYSFGPNRRRDSTRERILGDDVAAFLRGGPTRFNPLMRANNP